MINLGDHRGELHARGVTKLRGLLSKADVILARDLIYETATEHGLYTPTGWLRSENRFGYAKPFRTALKALSRSDNFPNLVSEALIELAEELLGERVTPLPPGQQILFTLPGTASWSVPKDVWHVDLPRLGKLGPPGLQMFTFLDDLQPKGGGTLVLAGSHRLLNTEYVTKSKDLKRLLRKEDYFRILFDKGRAPIIDLEDTAGSVDGVDLEIVELTGQAGDVFLMDLRTLHAPAPNNSETARLMLTCRLPRRAVASRWLNPEA